MCRVDVKPYYTYWLTTHLLQEAVTVKLKLTLTELHRPVNQMVNVGST